MVAELPIPEAIPQLFVVLVDAAPPSSAVLDGVVKRWVEARVSGGMAELLPRYLTLLETQVVSVDEVPLPPPALLRAMGSGAEEEARLQAASHAVIVRGLDLPLGPRVGTWAVLGAARAIALEFAGVLFDPSQRRLRPLDEHGEGPPEDLELSVGRHLVLPASRAAGGLWVTTLGMDRLGLPNLELRGVPEHLAREGNWLLNGVAQRLVEAQSLGAAAGEGSLALGVLEVGTEHIARACGLRLKEAASIAVNLTLIQEGEREALLQVHGPQGDAAAWVAEVIGVLLPTEDPLIHIAAGDEDMANAQARATAELPAIRARFHSGVELGDSVFVKAGFDADEGDFAEFMWIAVERWSEGSIAGRLANDPEHIQAMRAGHPVTVDEARVSDWIWSHADGSREGGYTVDVLMAREGGRSVPPG